MMDVHFNEEEQDEEKRNLLKTAARWHQCQEYGREYQLVPGTSGITVVMEPQMMEGTVMGFIHDPKGVLIEFIQPN